MSVTPEQERRGEQTYNLYESSELSWAKVAVRLGHNSGQAARASAKGHAHRVGAPWPPPRTQIDEMRLRVSQRRCYELHANGMPWVKISERQGAPAATCLSRAQRYAADKGLPWPVKNARPGRQPQPLAQAKQRLAYRLRRQGFTWEKVATQAGYGSGASAYMAAQLYALRERRRWPPPLQQRRAG